MIVLMVAAVGTLFVVWIVTGVRLMMLARRTRGTPELMLGAALLLQAGIGYPLSVVAPYAGELAPLVWLVSGTCNNGGMALLFAFTARVFHDGARWAWMIVGAAGALCAIQAGGNSLAQVSGDAAARAQSLLVWGAGSLTLSGLAWGWTGYEALRFYAQLRKRAALGLADPIVANRMFLWGAMGVIALSCVVIDAVLLYTAGEVGRTVVLPLVTAIAGLLVSVCMILAFWPPAAYLARVRASSAARS
jgi:hypothetical protein